MIPEQSDICKICYRGYFTAIQIFHFKYVVSICTISQIFSVWNNLSNISFQIFCLSTISQIFIPENNFSNILSYYNLSFIAMLLSVAWAPLHLLLMNVAIDCQKKTWGSSQKNIAIDYEKKQQAAHKKRKNNKKRRNRSSKKQEAAHKKCNRSAQKLKKHSVLDLRMKSCVQIK